MGDYSLVLEGVPLPRRAPALPSARDFLTSAGFGGAAALAAAIIVALVAVLVVRRTDDVESRSGVDLEVVRSPVRTVQEQARDLSQELRDLPSRYSAQWQVDAAAGYATAAANAYGAFLQRIAAATEQLARREENTDAEVIKSVTTMLGEHPWRR